MGNCNMRLMTKLQWIKIKINFLILLFGTVLLMPSKTAAQDSTADHYKNSMIVLPAFGSSPETSLLLGGVGIYQFKMGDPKKETRPSSVVLSGIYTLNNQSSVAIQPSLILENEKAILNGIFAYSYFPEAFWGVNTRMENENEMRLVYKQIHLEQNALLRWRPGIFIGPQFRWSGFYNIHFENPEGDAIAAPDFTGAKDYSVGGFGFSIRWDTRDRMMTPTKNHMIELSIMTNPSWLGTLDGYTSYLFDARKYVDVSNDGSSVLGFQFISKLSSGNPPINDMATLGGQNILRGYYQGQLRNHHGAQLQAELRQHLYGRFGIALFGAAGQVWNSFNNLSIDNTFLSAGGGIRFNLNEQDPTNIRIDYGIGSNSSGLYLTIGEAF